MRPAGDILTGIKNEVREKIASNHIRSTEEALGFIVDHYQLFTYFDEHGPQIGLFFGEIRTLCQAFGLPATDQELLDRLVTTDQDEPAKPPQKDPRDLPCIITLRLRRRTWYYRPVIWLLDALGLRQAA